MRFIISLWVRGLVGGGQAWVPHCWQVCMCVCVCMCWFVGSAENRQLAFTLLIRNSVIYLELNKL